MLVIKAYYDPEVWGERVSEGVQVTIEQLFERMKVYRGPAMFTFTEREFSMWRTPPAAYNEEEERFVHDVPDDLIFQMTSSSHETLQEMMKVILASLNEFWPGGTRLTLFKAEGGKAGVYMKTLS